MTKKSYLLTIAILFAAIVISCTDDILYPESSKDQSIIDKVLNLDLSNLFNYSNQNIPTYIAKDNTTAGNQITDAGATLGRVLFYDKELSSDRTISCASCHKQANAFSDSGKLSQGVNGLTARHSMRLVNARFSRELKFFWDERADNLEEQTTMPIQDHAEMGFSGIDGAPDINELINRLQNLDYYNILFKNAFGDENITENRIQKALAQFIRSIQSFDSKYDEGRSKVNNDMDPFPNYSVSENNGKTLFMARPIFDAEGKRISGGVGCVACHGAPEFDIDPNSLSNGVVFTPDQNDFDFTVTRAPSLRDLTNPEGEINSAFMHTGNFPTLQSTIEHYNEMPANPNTLEFIDRRLTPNGQPQRLQMTEDEIRDVIAFLKTLSGVDVYTNEKWADPFMEDSN
ncbi:cytochrome-c peroxidase [Marinigracilibium pacificum]|uniref:C-type cytochrome n=1 Tax=Marinigracilibium pacificum TaxID=2729599 RepID=A0A848IZH3_9BACT|nr:cytochrome c peroxidase [Marinigracilibium pacificum]NMM47690.1 c-type cytochrome [Marinigracilibium pacificum]